MSQLPDSFETLRDCRSFFLKQLGALLQDSALLSNSGIQAILQGAGNYFDEMISSSRRGSFAEEARGLTSSRITLVGEEDLELEIRLEQLSSRLFDATNSNLWKIHLRFVTLLRRPDLPKTNNPVGPNSIKSGLTNMFSAAGLGTTEKKLELLERLEDSLLASLPTLYVEINNYLDRYGVEAAEPTIITSPEIARRPFDDAPGITSNALLFLQQALASQLPGRLPGEGVASTVGNIGGGGGGAATSLLSQATMERLIFRLNEMDRPGGFATGPKAEAVPSLETLIPGLFSVADQALPSKPKSLKSAELGIPANAAEGLAIDTLAMIFEAIFNNPDLPDALKAIVSSLQITMLKVAMQDGSLFTDNSHPARRFLDHIGLAMLGLPPDVSARHPVCAQLFEIAGEIRSGFSGDQDVFTTALTRIDTLIAERNTRIGEQAEVYMPLLYQLDRRDQAAAQARQVIDKLISKGVPAPVREFLDNHWNRLLQLVWLEHGAAGEPWQASATVIEELLWTFEPKADPEERKALARRLPEILRQLKAGMERIGMDNDVQTAFLDTCFELQTRALRTASSSAEPSTANEIEAGGLHRAPSDPMSGEVQSGDLVLRTLDFANGHPVPPRILPCRPGDWLEMQVEEGETEIARLCHLSPNSQRALLFNPESDFALAVHPAILDRQFRDGTARICSTLSLFETAANQALQQTTRN